MEPVIAVFLRHCVYGAGEALELLRAGKAVISRLDQFDGDIVRAQAPGDLESRLFGDVHVLLTLQKDHGQVEVNVRFEQQVVRAVFEQRAGENIVVFVVRRHLNKALLHHPCLLLGRQLGPLQALGEIGRGSDADQPRDPLGPCQRGEQHQPPPHRRADQDLRPLGQRVDHREAVFGPAADGAIAKIAIRSAMAAVVEADEALSALTGQRLEIERLRALHIRAETTQKHQSGRGMACLWCEPVVDQSCPVGAN